MYNCWEEDDCIFLSKFGIKRVPNDNTPVKLEAGEVHDAILHHFMDKSEHKYFREHQVFKYSIEDITSSEYCFLLPMGCGGYPQYTGDSIVDWEEKFLYKSQTYCKRCGSEHNQVGEFHISKQPKRDLWSFTAWTFDALFVTERFYKEMFEPLGIGYHLVRKGHGKIFEGVLQLEIPIIDEELDLSMHKKTVCPVCGKVKYVQDWSLPCFPLHEHPLPHIYLTKESFGEGWEADRNIIISTELALKLIKLKLVHPCKLIPCRRNYAEFLKTVL